MKPDVGDRGPRGIACRTAVFAVVLALSAESLRAAEADAPALTAAGGTQAVWLIRTSPRESDASGGSGWVSRFACQDIKGGKLDSARLAPQIGRIARAAASGAQVFVFFDDGTHHSYAMGSRQIEIDLPGRAIPDVIAGMTGDGEVGFYALVRSSLGREVLRRERQLAAATQRSARRVASTRSAPPVRPAPGSVGRDEPSTSTLEAHMPEASPEGSVETTRPAGDRPHKDGLDLIAYERGRWQFVGPVEGLPPGLPVEQVRMCAAPDAVYVFWPATTERDVTTLHCLRWSRTGRVWAPGPAIDAGGVLRQATAVFVEPRVVLAAVVAPDAFATEAPETLPSPPRDGVWRLWKLIDEHWEPSEPLTLDATQEAETVPADAIAIAALGSSLFVAVSRGDGSIETGLWPVEGGAPRRPLTKTLAFEAPQRPLVDERTREWLGLAIVIATVAMVFWRRQESLSAPVRLPEGLVLAAYGKRFGAALLDLLPALALTAWVWYGPAIAYYVEVAGAAWRGAAPPPDRLFLGWALARLVYVIYCGVFEWAWGTTPGKRVFGCVVLGQDGQRPGVRAVVLRNIMRLLELEPYLQVWPLLLIIFFTRNRQRLGDLLAQTVVVEPGTSEPPPERNDDET